VLVNRGGVAAQVTAVELHLPAGGGLSGRYRVEPPGPGDGGFVSVLTVRAGGAMKVEFATTDDSLGAGLGVAGSVPPRMRITASTEDPDWDGTRAIELLRRTGGVTAALRWQPHAVE